VSTPRSSRRTAGFGGGGTGGFNQEQIEDIVGGLIVAGTGITVLYDDAADELVISATGGGGGDVATDTIWDAKGDLAAGTGSNTAIRLAVGTNGHALIADSAETAGLIWRALAAADIASGTFDVARIPVAAVQNNAVQTAKTAAYELVLGDRTQIVQMNATGAVNLTVPTNANQAFATGDSVHVYNIHATGQVSVVGDTGVTVRARGGANKTAGQYAVFTLTKVGTDEWVVYGDLIA